MKQVISIISIGIWIAAAGFAAYRVATAETIMLGAVEGLMVLIAAFVANKTLDLVMMTAAKNDED